jgi:hypothetical protein
VYCYDTAPCHFQEGFHGNDDGLGSFETYPCFSQTHGYNTIADDLTTIASSAPTPALSISTPRRAGSEILADVLPLDNMRTTVMSVLSKFIVYGK